MLQTSGKIRLLDVGSCFNPFLKFEEFLTVGIDIVPAVEVCIVLFILRLEDPTYTYIVFYIPEIASMFPVYKLIRNFFQKQIYSMN